MLKWKKRLVDVCPRCGHKQENTQYILECKASSAVGIWLKEINKLKVWLKVPHTCPQLRQALTEGITSWKVGSHNTDRIEFTYTGIKVPILNQSKLGWRRLIEGTISKRWRAIQDHYYRTMNIPKFSDMWAARLIVKMWEIIYSIWQHRNSCLHNTPMADLMGGSYALERALRNEWELGFEGLPRIVQVSILESISQVLEGTTHERKGWFVMIRRAGELSQIYEAMDEFSDQSSSLRKWAGF